nr:coat protein [Polygonatum kingianum cryptic virus 2]
MANAGNDALPNADQQVTAAPKPPPKAAIKPQLSKVVNFLEDTTRIGTFYVNHPRYRRYVDLKRNEIFNSLVDMYTIVFKTFWNQFRRFIETAEIPVIYAATPQRYAAAVYISAWFYDLYVSNRDACRKLSDSAYIEHYYLDLVHKSMEYDVFLTALNAQIRPTNIKLTHEDTLFIPRIRNTINNNPANENYFNITGWVMDEPILQGILYVFKDRKILNMEALSETTLGRPSWLFDWHNDNLCYAWFPTEGNYTFDDVTIAYITGVACTPKLAPRDTDEWQLLPGNVTPANLDNLILNRVRPLTYHGAVEIRVLETRIWQLPTGYRNFITLAAAPAQIQGSAPPGQQGGTSAHTQQAKKQKQQLLTGPHYPLRSRAATSQASAPHTTQGEEEGQGDNTEEGEVHSSPDAAVLTGQIANVDYTVAIPPFHQVRIIDYLYHARVVNYMDFNTRVAALRQFIYQPK